MHLRNQFVIFLLITARCAAALTFETPSLTMPIKGNARSVSGEFKFINEGAAPVTIKSIQPSCGCTTTEIGQTIIPPGTSHKIGVRMSVGPEGEAKPKTILVVTDEPIANLYLLTIAAKPMERITISPTEVFWRHDEAITEKQILVEVLPGSFHLRLTSATTTKNAFITFVLSQGSEPAKFIVKVRPARSGSISDRLKLTFQPDAGEPFSRTVALHVLPDLSNLSAMKSTQANEN